jgi:predicted transposase YbfD/YdcC
VFVAWLNQLPLESLPEGEREIIALDGKTSRGSATPLTKALHTVSVYSVQHALVLRAASVPEKSNEITVLPDLIRMVAPVGAIVTTDAMGCQKEVANAVREIAQTDYLLALKNNHPRLEADARWLFAYHDREGWDNTDHSFHMTENSGHGRTEVRECWLIRELSAVEQADQWKDLNALVRVRATRTVGERTSIEERLYLTSLCGEASEALQASRLHWGIENGLHWLLDVTFQDDASKVKVRVARQNWMALRQLALGILRRPGAGQGSVTSKRFRAALDSHYLQRLLTLR